MADHIEEVEVDLLNDKVLFSGISKTHPEWKVMIDYKPPLGDDNGFNGLELLLMSLAGCGGTAVVYLLRKMNINVAGLKVQATGIRRTEPPIKFEHIRLNFIIRSNNITESAIQKAIQLSEESLCPVWQMIKNNVEVQTSFNLLPE